MKTLISSLFIFAVTFNSASAQIYDAVIDNIQGILDSKLNPYGIEGAGLTVIFPNDTVVTFTSGYANGINDPIRTEKNWHWASGTKPLTGFVILQMIEEGLFGVDEPIGNLIDTESIPNLDSTITIKELLQHTSGLNEVWGSDEVPELWQAVWGNRNKIWEPDDLLQFMPEPRGGRGSHHYASSNNYILNHIIEQVTGMELDSAFKERIFEPLEMNSSYVSARKSTDMTTVNGVWSGNDNRSTWSHDSYLSSRHAHISTSMDAAKFYRNFYSDSLLSKESMDALREPANNSSEVLVENVACFSRITQTHGYETSIFTILDTNGKTWSLYGHGGNGIHNSFSYHWAEKNITMILAINDFSAINTFGALIFDVLCGLDDVVAVSNETESLEIADKFILNQNYPNPFNPTTNISYELPSTSQVELKVYNSLGQEVATLVDTKMNAGHHSVEFDASRLSSGIYIYRLVSDGQSITRKMMLIK